MKDFPSHDPARHLPPTNINLQCLMHKSRPTKTLIPLISPLEGRLLKTSHLQGTYFSLAVQPQCYTAKDYGTDAGL
jgi:hypothetical protein